MQNNEKEKAKASKTMKETPVWVYYCSCVSLNEYICTYFKLFNILSCLVYAYLANDDIFLEIFLMFKCNKYKNIP